MKRVFPTTRGWVVIFLAIGMLIMSFVRPSFMTAAFAALLWSVVLVSLPVALVSLGRVRVERRPSQDGFLGTMVSLPVMIHNLSNRTRQAMVLAEHCDFSSDHWECHVVEPLGPRESRHVERPIYAARRGEFTQHRVILRGGDPAGIFRCSRTFAEEQKLLIKPELEDLAWLPLQRNDHSRASAIGQSVAARGSAQDFFGIREYRPTDGIRHVDWKASARQQRLMVREFEEDSTHMISILLDTNQRYRNRHPVSSNFEFLVKVTASLAQHLAGINCNLLFSCAEQDAVDEFNGPAQTVHDDLFHFLTYVRPGKSDFVEQLDKVLELIDPNSLVFCLTMHEPDGLEERFEVLLQQGIEVRWIYAPPQLFDPHQAANEEWVNRIVVEKDRLVQPVVANPRTNVANVLMESQI